MNRHARTSFFVVVLCIFTNCPLQSSWYRPFMHYMTIASTKIRQHKIAFAAASAAVTCAGYLLYRVAYAKLRSDESFLKKELKVTVDSMEAGLNSGNFSCKDRVDNPGWSGRGRSFYLAAFAQHGNGLGIITCNQRVIKRMIRGNPGKDIELRVNNILSELAHSCFD